MENTTKEKIFDAALVSFVENGYKGTNLRPDTQDRTPEEDAMLDLLLHGGNLVSADNLNKLLAWYGEQ